MKYSYTFNGWLGKIADDFTYRQFFTLGTILANYFKQKHSPGQKVIIGYDTRFFAKEFAEFLSFIMATNDLKVFIANKPAPSSVLVSTSLYKKSMGTIVLTADEQDARFLGVRAYDANGYLLNAEMLSNYTEVSKKYDGNYEKSDFHKFIQKGMIEPYDPAISYHRHVEQAMQFTNSKICTNRTVFNPLYGSGVDYFGDILKAHDLLGYTYDYEQVSDFKRLEPSPSLHAEILSEDMLREGSELGFMVSPDCSTFQFLIGPHRLTNQETLYLLLERMAKSGTVGTVLLSEEMMIKSTAIERLGFSINTVKNKQFQSALREKDYLIALDQMGRFYFSHHGAADALFVGYHLVDIFNDRMLTLAKIDQKVKSIREMV